MKTLDFLQALLPDAGRNGAIEFRIFDKDRGRPPRSEWLWQLSHPGVKYILETYKEEDVYFGVAPRPSAYGKKQEDIEQLHCVWLDVDDKRNPNAEAELATTYPAPTIVVASGGGAHAYWLLTKWAKPTAGLKAFMHSKAVELQGDAQCRNFDRILRLPGSKNWKYDPPRDCDVVLNNLGNSRFIYAAAELEEIGEDFETKRKMREARVVPSLPRMAEAGPSIQSEAYELALLAWRDGQRHEAALAYSGFLLRAGVVLPTAEETITRICHSVGDQELGDRLRALRDTYSSNAATTGLKTLRSLAR